MPHGQAIDDALVLLADLVGHGTLSRDHGRVLARGLERPDGTGLQRDLCDLLQFTDTQWIRPTDIQAAADLIRHGRPRAELPEGWSSPAEGTVVLHEMAWFEGTLGDLTDRPLPLRRTVWDGLGRGAYALLAAPSGEQVCVCSFLDTPHEPRLELRAQSASAAQAFMDWAGLDRDDAAVLGDALRHLSWPTVEVWRQDDNGGEFVVSRHTSAHKATQLAQRFEARGHKQTYWVQGTDSSG